MSQPNTPAPVWERPLESLSTSEWESLCDGCGRCCVHKLEDEDTGELFFTNIACRHLDSDNVRCQVYAERSRRVPDCIDLRTAGQQAFAWLPSTCAYRRRAGGQPLPSWHPLLTGDGRAMAKAGVTVSGRVVDERQVHPDAWEDHVVRWIS